MPRRSLSGSRPTLVLAASLFVLSSSAVAAAEGTNAADANDEAAESEKPDVEPNAAVEEISVWGVRTGWLPSLATVSTDLIHVDDFTAENKGLADLLQESEGVSVRRFGGPGDRSEVSIRGSTPNQVVVTLDGIRANSMLTGSLDLSRICLPLVDQIEITRGAGSIQEGSGAIGGTVNVVSRAGASKPTTRAALSGGAFDTLSGTVLHANRSGDLDYTVGYCGFRTDGDFEFQRPVIRSDGFETGFEPDSTKRINNEQVQHGANLGLDWHVGPGVVRFLDVASYASSGEPGIDSGNGVIAGQRTDAHSRDLSNLAQIRWESRSPTGWGDDFAVALYHRFERNAFRDPVLPFADPLDLTTRLSTAGLRARDHWQTELLGQPLESRVSLDVTHEQLRSTDRSGRERPAVAGALREQLGLLSDRVLLSAAARVDWTDGFDPQVLPALGLAIEPARWIRFRGQAGRAYRAPGFDELFHPDQGFLRGNPDLSPEDAWNIDGGFELDFASVGPLSKVSLKATGFYREIDESIVWVRISLNTIAPINTGPATTRGFEVSGSFDVTDWVRLSANHTWTDSERDDNGARLAGQPEHETFARLRVGPEKVWKLIAEVQRLSEILVDAGGSLRLPARTVWNASASLNLAELSFLPVERYAGELWVFVALDNLSDEAVRDSVSYPQPGRNGSAGFEVRW